MMDINSKIVREYIAFNLSGSCIFIICQIVYLFLLLKLEVSYLISSIICSGISSILNYIFNSYLVFKSREHSLLKIFQIILIYFFESLPNSIILIIVIEIFNVPEALGTMIAPMIITPIMFLISKSILTNKTKEKYL